MFQINLPEALSAQPHSPPSQLVSRPSQPFIITGYLSNRQSLQSYFISIINCVQFQTMFASLTAQDDHLASSSKSEEQIRRLTTEEDLGEPKRTIHLLKKGEPLQRRAIYDSLCRFLKQNPAAYHTVFAIIRDTSIDQESQPSIARELFRLFDEDFPVDEQQYSELLRFVMAMFEQWNQKASDTWVDLFRVLASRKEFPVFEKEALTTIIRLSDAREIQPIKIVALKALGQLSQTMKGRLRGVMLDRIRGYCRDPDKQLRLSLLKDVLPLLYENLPPDLVGIYFTERVFEMIYDPDVKYAALKLLFSHCEYFSNQQRQTRITNILLEHLETGNEQAMLIISEKIGELYVKLRQYLEKNPRNSQNFLKGVLQMSKAANSQIRYNFLFNLPGLLYYLDLKLWTQLLYDPIKQVRSLALLVFHQVVQLCSKNFSQYSEVCQNLLESILQTSDSAEKKCLITETFTGLLDHIDLLMGGIFRQILQLEQKEQTSDHLALLLAKMCSTIIQIIEVAFGLDKHQIVQRLHKKMLASSAFFSPEHLLKEYYPVLVNQLGCFNWLTLNDCIKSLCSTLYLNTEFPRLENEFMRSSYWKKRYVYLRISKALLEHFSFRKYREVNLLRLSLTLSNDKIAEVRSQCISYAEACFKMLDLQPDEFKSLMECKERWKNDNNILVAEAFKSMESVVDSSEDQKEHWRILRCIRNQEKLRHQQSMLHNTANLMEEPLMKTVPPKRAILKKQFGSKFASKLKAKINTSLSTNNLGFHSSLRSDPILEKNSEKRQCNSANKELLEVVTNLKRLSENSKEVIKRRRPSIDVTTQIIRRDSMNRGPIKKPERKKNIATEKRLQ